MSRKPKMKTTDKEDNKVTKTGRGRRSKPNARGNRRDERIDKPDMSNNPAWYFKDLRLADQVSQLSFQNLAGYPIVYDGKQFDVPNIVRIQLNPAPGVQLSQRYNTQMAQNSAINMAAFRLYSRLSAFTGRTQSYGPQDVGTMLLAFGELISQVEFIRRAFGVSQVTNKRNRDYPKRVLAFGMLIDPDDMFANLSNYRTQFNTLITLIEQLPIPKGVAYFDKCAKLYEKIYLDTPSSMAQTLILVPHSTWILNESAYSGGSILETTPWCCNTLWQIPATYSPLSYYLNTLAATIGALLNSTTLQIVYTDILNLASKAGMEFWKFDYLYEDYTVIPEFDANFMLQMHNATLTGIPRVESQLVTGTDNVTPYNDVYPDPNTNTLFYNPAFATINNVPNGMARTGNTALIDMLTDTPTIIDRVEVTRFISISNGTAYTPTGQTQPIAYIDTALPDHYVVCCEFESQTNNLTVHNAYTTVIGNNGSFEDVSSQVANIDWAPRFFEVDMNTNQLTGRYTGDVNFYTVVDHDYIRKLHDFVGLALYELS